MKHRILLFIFLLMVFQAQGQQQLLQERNYKTNSNEKQISLSAKDGTGNIFFTGPALISTRNFTNYFLLIKPNTDTIWTRKGQTNLFIGDHALRNTADGGFIVCAASKHISIGGISGLLMQKLNPSGVLKWTRNNYFNNADVNIPFSVLAMPDKGYLVGGLIKGLGYSFLRTDSLGNQKWIRNYTYSDWDGVVDMQVAKSGNIMTAGMAKGNLSNTWKLKLMLINHNGDSLKGNQFRIRGGGLREGMYSNWNSLTPLSDGGYLLTAYTDTVTAIYPNGSKMGMIIKVDSSLNLKWKYIHRTPTADEYVFSKTKELKDSTILVLGFQFRPAQGGNGFQLYHFSKKGNLLATYPFTSSICSQVWGLTFDALNDSTYMIGGRCGNNPPITFGFYVAKVKLPGLPQPMPTILPGWVTGITQERQKTAAYLGQSYPNPTSSTAIIPYTLPVSSQEAEIIIQDITGREVGNYALRKNSSSLEVNLSNLQNGLYTYTMVTDGKPVATRKLAIMK